MGVGASIEVCHPRQLTVYYVHGFYSFLPSRYTRLFRWAPSWRYLRPTLAGTVPRHSTNPLIPHHDTALVLALRARSFGLLALPMLECCAQLRAITLATFFPFTGFPKANWDGAWVAVGDGWGDLPASFLLLQELHGAPTARPWPGKSP